MMLSACMCTLLLLLTLTQEAHSFPENPTAAAALRETGSFSVHPRLPAMHDAPATSSTRAAASRGYGGDAATTVPARRLLHGPLKPSKYPRCPRCKIIGCAGNWLTGHCRLGGKLYNCKRHKQSTASATAPPDSAVTLTSAPETGDPPAGNVTVAMQETTTPDPKLPARMPAAITTRAAPYIACMHDAHCALPVHEFASVNGSEPTSIGGKLDAYCSDELPEDSDAASERVEAAGGAGRPGLCVCKYASRTSSTAAMSSSAAPQGQPGSRAAFLRSARNATRTARSVAELCVLKPVLLPGGESNSSAYTHADHAVAGPEYQLSALRAAGGADATDGTSSFAVAAAGTALCSVSFDGADGDVVEDSEVDEELEVYEEDYGGGGGDDREGVVTARASVSVRQEGNETEVVESTNTTGGSSASVATVVNASTPDAGSS
eukprot:jgi/Ulvmu1/1965/UM012_0127.1